MEKFQAKIVCQSCNGTGLYSGMGEDKHSAVVCSKCKGTGCFEYKFEYEEFVKRASKPDIKWVSDKSRHWGR